ncbi:MAG: HMA2 domain-containing protein [Oligoflexales bacterium]
MISVHQLPGRIRVRSSRLKKNDLLAREIESAILDLYGIKSVRISSITGSILVFYNASLIHSGPIFRELKNLNIMANVIGFPRSFPEIYIRRIFINL